jgi:DNA topoisomerase-1
VLAEAKSGGRRGPQLIRELGPHPEGGTVGLYRGRYGPYVSHEGLIASLPKAGDPDTFTLAEALPLIAAQKAKGKTARKARRPAAKAAPSRPAAKSASARGAAGKPAARAPAKKKPARRATPAKSRAAPSRRPASS